ncbi:MAG: hypothetical protein Q8M99_02640 [Methylotenera sp.]|nr:hypothetical protein [Methylotenera sp.]
MSILKLAISVASLLLLISCADHNISTEVQPIPTNLKEDKQQIYLASLNQVNALIKEKKYREAELILTREAQKHESDFVVQSKLLYINSAQAKLSLSKNDFLSSGLDIEAGETALITLKQIVLMPESEVPKDFAKILKGQEDELLVIRNNLTRSIDGYCNKQFAEADALAKEAKSMIASNDRDMIIAGLVKVRECNQFGKWASVDNKGKSTNSVRKLLNLAEEKEHDSLLRAAGFGFQ